MIDEVKKSKRATNHEQALRKKDGLIFFVVMIVVVILATIGMSSSSWLQTLAVSFDTWTHENTVLQCSMAERTDENESNLISVFAGMVSTKKLDVKNVNIYTIAVDEKYQAEQFKVEYEDKIFECAMGRLRTKTIYSSKRLEYYNEYALFRENYEASSGVATFITRSMADLMLGEEKEKIEDYQTLIGQTYQMNGMECYILNIIDDRNEGLLGYEWKMMYGYVSFIVSGALRDVDHAAVAVHVKTQPYFMNTLLSECVNPNSSLIADTQLITQNSDKSYSLNEFETNKVKELMKSNVSFFPTGFSPNCILVISTIVLLAYFVKLFFFDKRTIGILRFSLFSLFACTAIITVTDMIAFAFLGWSYNFTLIFAFVPMTTCLIVECLNILIWLIARFIKPRLEEKHAEK